MEKKLLQILSGAALFFLVVANVAAHCEIPCGIYDDEMRINMLLEHIATIEKSMAQIIALEQENQANSNQLVRWVLNKERHADDLQEIVSQYFLTQRLKPDAKDKDYDRKLAILHQMLAYGMKCKQTTDLGNPAALRSLVGEFKELYFSSK